MAKIKGNGKIMPVFKLRYALKDGKTNDLSVDPVLTKTGIDAEKTALKMAHKYGLVCLKFDRRASQTVIPFLNKLFELKTWREKELIGTIEIFYKKRNNDQNSLLWGLLSVLSMELYHDNGHTEELYYQIVDLVAPRVVSRLTGNTVAKRGSSLSTVEFAQLIEWVFNYFMEHGVNLSSPEDIEHYWTEWANWRWSQGVDPLSQTYKDSNEYREKVNYCEACRTFLRYDASVKRYDTETGKEGNLAHIVSKGSGGSDDLFNRMHLCVEHHVYLQHQNGWSRLVSEYPHLKNRVNIAREKAGQMPVEDLQAETHQDIEPKTLPEPKKAIENKKYLYNCGDTLDWTISSEDLTPVYDRVCEAEQGEVLESISIAFKNNAIDSVQADKILGKVGAMPFYVDYEKENMIDVTETAKEPPKGNLYLWNNIKTGEFWISTDNNDLSADIKMICNADKDNVLMEIARIYEKGAICAEIADKILQEVGGIPQYVNFEAQKDSQKDLFDEKEGEESEIDEELDIF